MHQCLNGTVAQRTINKQKSMCELAKLPMFICSESIETISCQQQKIYQWKKLHHPSLQNTKIKILI